jgi:hypothetical protein
MVNTLPEITIYGDPKSNPTTSADWWATGFTDGYNAPNDAHPLPALVLNNEMAASYFIGVLDGMRAVQAANAAVDTAMAKQPGVEIDIGGISLEEAQREYNEAFEKLFHQHMPHIEIEEYKEEKPVLPKMGIFPD